MNFTHKGLASGRWLQLTFMEQMANIGTEVGRASSRNKSGDKENSRLAFERALELLVLTISDPRNRLRLKELTRVKELLIDYFAFDNSYRSSDEGWNRYFLPFNFAARRGR